MLVCPISHETFCDSVVTAVGESAARSSFLCLTLRLRTDDDPSTARVRAGTTYERRHITSWLHTHCTDPLTNERLNSKKLVPNLALRSAAAEWREEHVPLDSSAATAFADERGS
jgi:hypothetical protein